MGSSLVLFGEVCCYVVCMVYLCRCCLMVGGGFSMSFFPWLAVVVVGCDLFVFLVLEFLVPLFSLYFLEFSLFYSIIL